MRRKHQIEVGIQAHCLASSGDVDPFATGRCLVFDCPMDTALNKLLYPHCDVYAWIWVQYQHR